MSKRTNKMLDGLKPYQLSEAEKKEVLWLIKEKIYDNIQHYIDEMTLLYNGKLKDDKGKLIII